MRYLLVTRGALGLCLILAAMGCSALKSGVKKGAAEYQAPANQIAGAKCEDESWCRQGLTCEKGKCQPCGCLKKNNACRLTAECGSDLYCGSMRKCVDAGEADKDEACKATADCKRGLICTVVGLSARCVETGDAQEGAKCSVIADCAAGLACETGPVIAATDAGSEDAGSEEDAGSSENDQQKSMTVCASPSTTKQEKPAFISWEGVECVDDAATATAYFDVPRTGTAGNDFYRLPFPNDIRRTAKGLDLSGHPEPPANLGMPLVGRYWQAAEQDLTGFATNPVVVFRFSEDVAPDTVNGDNVHIKDITAGSPTYNLERNRRWQLNPNQTAYLCPNTLSVTLSAPLRPNTTYAVYITTGVLPDEGGSFARSADLDAMLADSAPSKQVLTSAYQAYAPFRKWLADSKTPAASILNVAVFTTQDPEAMLPKLRAAVQAASSPSVSGLMRCGSGVASPCADGSETRDCGSSNANFVELHGRIALPIFQKGTAPYETPDQGGGITVTSDGSAAVARTEEVCFALTVPVQAPPESGYPLLIYGHGTGGGFTSAVNEGFAEQFAVGTVDGASTPVVQAATLTIDLPQHGTRRGGSNKDPEELFYNYLNPRAARDNVLQGSADLMSLVRWAKSYTLAASASPSNNAIRFNSGRIAVLGHSQGATHASLMLPYEPDVVAGMLSGQGGNLTQSLLNKTKPFDVAATLPYALMEEDGNGGVIGGAYHPILAILQMFFERVDPVNYAYRIWREPTQQVPAGHHIFMSYGLNDNYTPEETQKAYASNAEFTVVRPELVAIASNKAGQETLKIADPAMKDNVSIGGVARTIGLRQYSPAAGQDGHFVAVAKNTEGRTDAVRFLLQALAGQSPQIGK